MTFRSKLKSQYLPISLLLSAPYLSAQSAATTDKSAANQTESRPAAERSASYVDTRPEQTFYLSNSTGQNDGNEILTALRLILEPSVKLYLTPNQNAITVRATPEQLALITKLLAELDRPHKSFRLTYTLTDSDGGKRIGVQHFSFVVLSGQRTTLKNGTKIPIATGSYNDGSSGAKGEQTQFTYLDIGLNFDATLFDSPGGERLVSKVEQSSAADHTTISGVTEPIIRQSVLTGDSMLQPGKPLVLGSLDIPDSTRHLEVEVVVEPLR